MSARRFGVPIDLQKQELQNAVIQVLATAPASPVAGQIYYDSVASRLVFRTASAWIDGTDRANHTGSQLAATISNFDTQVRTSRLDQMAAPTASVSLNSQKITNLLDGTAAQDAVSFSQLQAVLQGRDFKDSVRVATTAAGTLATAFANGQTVDGVVLATGNRILLKDQAAGAENGIYTVNASGAPTRATDADSSTKVTANMSVLVEEGTANQDKQFTLTTNGPITLGTTALVFAQTGSGTTYVQGTGITISGGTVSIDTAVTARRFATTIGDGSTTTIAVAHGLATVDVMVQVYEISTGATVECDQVRTSTSNLNLIFAVAPTTNQFRVVVTA